MRARRVVKLSHAHGHGHMHNWIVLCSVHVCPCKKMEQRRDNIVRVGSRSSELAMIQTHTIISELEKIHPKLNFEVTTMKTIGDNILDKPLPNIGQTNLFTKELEIALESREVDMIVHSLKDLPTVLPPGMRVSVIYKRDNPTDALVLNQKHIGKSIHQLPSGSVIGTSSLRRIAQLKRTFPHLVFKSVRGNLNTRLRKLDTSGEYDALILATAGIIRMGWKERISEELDPNLCMYAVGQGALAVETRSDDKFIVDLVSSLNDLYTLICCTAERQFLHGLGGGCSVPVGVISSINNDDLIIEGAVFSLDGSKLVKDKLTSKLPQDYEGLATSEIVEFSVGVGTQLSRSLLDNGAGVILEEARMETDAATATISTDNK